MILPTGSPRPQLQMVRQTLDDLPSGAMPPPYSLRTYQQGDEMAWAAIMNTGIGQGWTVERCRERLTGLAQFADEGLYFAVAPTGEGETVAGSACAWRRSVDETQTGYVHMVCVLPEHRGHRLGYWLTLATLSYFRRHGFSQAILNTDDFRLPAIQTYLNLGFVPDLIHESDAERWAAVMAVL